MKYILHIIISFCLLLTACGHNSEIDRQMDRAEGLMLSAPDSSLLILDNIQAGDLSGKEQKARYALLKSMALDKNYIDTTTFDVLQPAIDYYIENGTPDEKLRTYFYQGLIFFKREDYDNAMQAFLKAEDITEFNDTTTYANMLVAQGNLFIRSYQTADYISNNLNAAKLYGKIGKTPSQQSCLIRALDGYVSINDSARADSIMVILDSMTLDSLKSNKRLSLVKYSYILRFGAEDKLKALLDSICDNNGIDNEIKLDFAKGYLKLNEPKRAKLLYESIKPDTSNVEFFLTYNLIGSEVFEANGEYEDANTLLKDFYNALEAKNDVVYSTQTKIAQERHSVEIKNLQQLRYKNSIIWLSVCSILVLLLVIGIISYFYRLGNMKRMIAENDKSRLQLENDNLQKKNSVLALEKRAAELETERQNLASENMRLRVSQLESENEQLKDLSEREELPDDVKAVIKERIEMLNAIFAAKILDKDANSSSYDDWVKRELGDKERFMNSNRLAYKVSHPMFIKYLEEHGLTEYEINYLCLYAIGLKGKEVGSYMELRRHYNISSEIRRKLGIDEHDTNIGIYVKKLLKRF